MKSLRLWVPATAIGLCLLWTGVSRAQELKKVRFGYPSLGFRQGHIWVAKDEGIFKKYGLDVEPIFLRGGQLAIQALTGGDPPLMSIGQVVQAGLAGFDLTLVAGVEIYYDSTVFARPEITRLEQLKGKRSASGPPGTSCQSLSGSSLRCWARMIAAKCVAAP